MNTTTKTNPIKIHSMTDLITNSSTVIYTYSDRSPKALKEMIDEVFSVLGVDQKCDDVFTISVAKDSAELDLDACVDWAVDNSDMSGVPEVFSGDDEDVWYHTMSDFLDDIGDGKMEKPKWFVNMEEGLEEESYDSYPPETTLKVIAKDPKYEKLAELVVKFLYSTNHEATRDG